MSARMLEEFLKRGDPAWGGQHPEKRRARREGAETSAMGARGDVEEAVKRWVERAQKPSA